MTLKSFSKISFSQYKKQVSPSSTNIHEKCGFTHKSYYKYLLFCSFVTYNRVKVHTFIK